MSLVGPRPMMPVHMIANLTCRPGITGAATFAFAREEAVLDRVPRHYLDAYYYSVVLPAKRRLDAEYMAHAGFFSDLKMIIKSVLRRWNNSTMEDLLHNANIPETREAIPIRPDTDLALNRAPKMPVMELPISVEQGMGMY